jgi:hypothetical protein
LARHFFAMFQCTTTGALSHPTTLAREAPGLRQMPSQLYCGPEDDLEHLLAIDFDPPGVECCRASLATFAIA